MKFVNYTAPVKKSKTVNPEPQNYYDVIKIRDCKKGEKVVLSSGEIYEQTDYKNGSLGSHIPKCTKNMGLSYYGG